MLLDEMCLLGRDLTSNNSIVNAVGSIRGNRMLWHVELLLGVLLNIDRHIWWRHGLHLSSSLWFFFLFSMVTFKHTLNQLCLSVALVLHELLIFSYS